ncbi:MAG: hypothetical protein IT304_11450 [Dehalococcoidia bacterium]|nr:hypothetical protein [Dehalococcoidia bacterium]
MDVLVLAPLVVALPDLPGARVVRYVDAEAACVGLDAVFDVALLLSDGLDAEGEAAVAAAVRASGRPVVEVQSVRWEGERHSPLTAACRGVVAGFGAHALAAVLRSLQE